MAVACSTSLVPLRSHVLCEAATSVMRLAHLGSILRVRRASFARDGVVALAQQGAVERAARHHLLELNSK